MSIQSLSRRIALERAYRIELATMRIPEPEMPLPAIIASLPVLWGTPEPDAAKWH